MLSGCRESTSSDLEASPRRRLIRIGAGGRRVLASLNMNKVSKLSLRHLRSTRRGRISNFFILSTFVIILRVLQAGYSLKPRCTLTFSKIGSQGRLGNQLFQLAALVSLARTHGARWRLPSGITHTELGMLFDVSKYASHELGMKVTVREGEEKDIFKRCKHGNVIDLEGYFQSLKYVENAQPHLRRILRLSKQLRLQVLADFPQLMARNIVTLHVRRGDYMKLHSYYNILEPQYYVMTLSLIKDFDEILVVSDDVRWVHMTLIPAIRERYAAVSISVSPGHSSLYDFVLLHAGRHIILANSSFSWWAAYLHLIHGSVDRDVYVASTWFNESGPYAGKNLHYVRGDFFPKEWNLVFYSGRAESTHAAKLMFKF